MSKNVAVFVDVANIFYAAKAAGTDIDYVTLLKSATAGRDFVRAYAYTGLDPENENQRQFHSFLARNGYKVISKDIRKYGDGRIKANLDIELVVDMMRMARNLDIAVVVSGDGDFAPAIRAVQQMGVRVEVISFRGNTSSDLIEVADTFTDIAQIARVERGSARSGRRVAAEGDLSMTEVPEKETEGAPRRGRGGRVRAAEPEERPVVAADSAGLPGNLIVLPGERLSRAPDEIEAPGIAGDVDEEAAAADMGGEDGASSAGEEGERRRRRRRGGRGRGRGRTAGEGAPIEEPAAAGVESEELEEEEFEEVGPAQLPHHTFGSVWDTQLGVPSAPLSLATGGTLSEDDDEDEDEPEIPEYLLAERRQRGQQRGPQRGRMGGRGRGAGYQAAVERERYGRAGAPGFGGPRLPDRQRVDRPRGGRPPQGRPGRPPERAPREQRPPDRQPGGMSGVPWSEVPPELEEQLRAELARHAPAPVDSALPPAPETSPAIVAPSDEPATAPKPRAPRRRTTAGAAAAGTGRAEAAPTADKPVRTTRRRASKTDPSADTATGEGSPEAPSEAPKPRRTSRGRPAPAGPPAASEGATPETAASQPTTDGAAREPAKPVRRRRTKPAEDAEPQA